MQTPPRLLRNTAQNAERNPPPLIERDALQRDRIYDIGQTVLATHGTHSVTMGALACALQIAVRTLRRHFTDLDDLLADLLRRHLRTLAAAIGQIPRTDPDCRAKRIAAYIAHTRTPLGGFTEPHLLLVRDRLQLPLDELQSIEQTRHGIGEAIAGDLAEEVLGLLDLPCFDATRIETTLATLQPLSLPQLSPQLAAGVAPAPLPVTQTPEAPVDWRQPPAPAPDDFLALVGQRGPIAPEIIAGHLGPGVAGTEVPNGGAVIAARNAPAADIGPETRQGAPPLDLAGV